MIWILSSMGRAHVQDGIMLQHCHYIYGRFERLSVIFLNLNPRPSKPQTVIPYPPLAIGLDTCLCLRWYTIPMVGTRHFGAVGIRHLHCLIVFPPFDICAIHGKTVDCIHDEKQSTIKLHCSAIYCNITLSLAPYTSICIQWHTLYCKHYRTAENWNCNSSVHKVCVWVTTPGDFLSFFEISSQLSCISLMLPRLHQFSGLTSRACH